MTRVLIPRVTALAVMLALAGCASTGKKPPVAASASPAAVARLAAIRQADVWKATDVAAMDIMTGPTGPGAFAPGATVTCDYRDKTAASGHSPKFFCVIAPDDEVKVKFGPANGEVFAEVAATRLLWALGFGADRMYPVQVVCRGCPPNITGTALATIQRKMAGKDIGAEGIVGWGWPELEWLDADAAPERRAERDALKLLAAFLQHTDSKPEQQRLLCIDGKASTGGAPCAKTFMMVHDLGLTFGEATRFNRNPISSANLPKWAGAPVWKDARRCVANLKKSRTGTLDNPVISEQGRQFLAGLLTQLTDAQLHDLFTVSRVTLRSASADGPAIAPEIDAWVAAFKAKRAEIVDHTCRPR